MYEWSCCRLCLSESNLSSIYTITSTNDLFLDVLTNVTGIKILPNDELPKEICKKCQTFISTCTKYRRNCQNAQTNLIEQLKTKKTDIKYEKCLTETIFVNENHSGVTKSVSEGSDYYNGGLSVSLKIEYVKNEIVDESPTANEELNEEDQETKTIEIELKEPTQEQKTKQTKNESKPKDKQTKAKTEKKSQKDTKVFIKKVIVEEETGKREKYQCMICNKILSTCTSIRNHVKIHTGYEVVCEHCGKKFISKRHLLMHCKAKHGYEKTDKCSFCEYRASNSEQVRVHERFHTGDRPFVCNTCNANFVRKSCYLQHIATHSTEKPIKCDQCPATFQTTTLMKIHANKHKERQFSYKCYVCHLSFARRRNVLRHLQRKHSVTNPGPIERVKML